MENKAEFKKENRYFVLKCTDIQGALNVKEKAELSQLGQLINEYRARNGKEELKCVVVEHNLGDVYENTWDAIQRKFEGREQLIAELRAENEMLRGLKPMFPPRPPEGSGLPRFGLRDNGHGQPMAVPMDDGYWVPAHLAEQRISELKGALTMLTRGMKTIADMEKSENKEPQESTLIKDLATSMHEAATEALNK